MAWASQSGSPHPISGPSHDRKVWESGKSPFMLVLKRPSCLRQQSNEEKEVTVSVVLGSAAAKACRAKSLHHIKGAVWERLCL